MRFSFFTALNAAALAASISAPLAVASDVQAAEVDDSIPEELAQICSNAECSAEPEYHGDEMEEAEVGAESESENEIDDTLLSQVASYIESLSADDLATMESYLTEIGESSED